MKDIYEKREGLTKDAIRLGHTRCAPLRTGRGNKRQSSKSRCRASRSVSMTAEVNRHCVHLGMCAEGRGEELDKTRREEVTKWHEYADAHGHVQLGLYQTGKPR